MKIDGRWVGYDEGGPLSKPIVWDADDRVGPRFTWPRHANRIIAVALLIAMGVLMGWSGFWMAFGVVLIALYRKIDYATIQGRERARLLADCDYQHAAWKQGHDRVAFFGRFPPPGNWKLGYLDGQRAENAPAAKPVFEPWWRATA